jgi:hypothetical protein
MDKFTSEAAGKVSCVGVLPVAPIPSRPEAREDDDDDDGLELGDTVCESEDAEVPVGLDGALVEEVC